MSEFTPIETQEQLNEIIGERIRRAEAKAAEKFAGWISPDDLEVIKADYDSKIRTLEDAAAEAQKTIESKDAKIAEGEGYRTDLEKTKIALAAGLKMEYADRLRGENADEWKADAEALAKDFAQSNATVPLGTGEPEITEDAPSAAEHKFKEWFKETVQEA